MKMIRDDGKVRLSLEGDLTVSHAAELKKLIVEALEGGDLVELDLRDATDMDLSFMQLVCSAHRSAMAAGKKIVFSPGKNARVAEVRKQAGFVFTRGCANVPAKSCLWVGGTD